MGRGNNSNNFYSNDPALEAEKQRLAIQLQQRDTELARMRDQSNRENELLSKARAGRSADLAEGRARGNELFSEGALGRVDASRSGEIADIIARRREQLAGYTPEEQQALRQRNLGQVNRSLVANQRGLRADQARSGVFGRQAAAQQNKLRSDAMGSTAEAERSLFMDNIGQKRAALGEYEKSLGGARADELERQKFNIDKQGAEKYGQLTTEMGYGSLGAGERSAVMQQALGEAQARAAQQQQKQNQGKK